MATGFVQRWKGKVAADAFWYKGWNQDVSTPAAASTAGSFMNQILVSASAASVFTLQPPEAGVVQRLLMNPSSAILVKAAPGTNFGVFGGTTEIVLKSTTIMTVELIGLSSVAWQVVSAWSTSTTVIPQPT